MENVLLNYKDDIILIETGQDGYGDNEIIHAEHLKGLYLQGTSQSESGFVESLSTSSHIYLDIENEFVKQNAYRLEGMYIIANIYDGKDNQSWFKITNVKIGQRKLLDNEINNIHCQLSKTAPLIYEES